jgi:RNA polymerase sigma-70 factor (ECF subfamily)
LRYTGCNVVSSARFVLFPYIPKNPDFSRRVGVGYLNSLHDAPLREPRAYLATVARRLLINQLRRQSLEQAYLAALAALPEPQAPSPEQQLVILQALQELDALLDGLPPKVRAVFVLSQVDGLTYAAIAEELGMGLRSVTRYMAQAMAECILLAP